MRKHDNTPNAARTLDALRSVGYDFNAAVADLVDNSIAAGAVNVWVFFYRSGDDFRLRIVDNGRGMTADAVKEAMRLGTETTYEQGSLGKYGFGLKTASISQCRRLTVLSRAKRDQEYHGFTLDIDEVHKSNQWEITETSAGDIGKYVETRMVPSGTGTSVLWEKIDRLAEEYNSFQREGAADNWVGRKLDELKQHLSMVFHRFLDGSAERRKPLVISFNGNKLVPWDPFCTAEPNTRRLHEKAFIPREHGCSAPVRVKPYILPVREGPGGFSSRQAWESAAGPLKWNDSQGYYVYREDRLIHFGGWLWTRAKDEHVKCARVALLFRSEHDDAFEISVNKVQVKLPASLREFLVNEVNPEVVKIANETYRGSARGGDTGNRHKRSSQVVKSTAPTAMQEDRVSVQPNGAGHIEVHNPKGRFVLNPERDTIDMGLQRFEIRTGVVEDGAVWKLVGTPECGFAVILNSDHPFYQLAYENGKPTAALTILQDALLCAMAYAELRCGSTGNLSLFNEIRHAVSQFLEKWTADALQTTPLSSRKSS